MATVQIFSKSSGNSLKHTKVAFGFSSLLGGGVTSGQYTNVNGKVYVDSAAEKVEHLSSHVVVYL